MNIARRNVLLAGMGFVAAGSIPATLLSRKYSSNHRPKRSRVAILNVDHYSADLTHLIDSALRLFSLNVTGKTVLLKPNLVDPGVAVNTHPSLIVAAAECFRIRGATSVIVADGPGHERDTRLLLCASGYETLLQDEEIRFVDLNRDELVRTDLQASYTSLRRLWLPRTVLEADFLVSMPKMKTHHWSGVTLSLKNMFGIVPGMRYGWPKNILHWAGIQESIIDLCATVPIDLVIADGIMAMEGNGPLNGTARHLGKIVLSDDPVAADATCVRLMGLEPHRIAHIRESSRFLGNLQSIAIDQIGESLVVPAVPFELVPDWNHLYAR